MLSEEYIIQSCFYTNRTLCIHSSSFAFLLTIFLSPSLTLVLAIVIVQLVSHVRLFVTPWAVAPQVSLALTLSWSWPNIDTCGFPLLFFRSV